MLLNYFIHPVIMITKLYLIYPLNSHTSNHIVPNSLRYIKSRRLFSETKKPPIKANDDLGNHHVHAKCDYVTEENPIGKGKEIGQNGNKTVDHVMAIHPLWGLLEIYNIYIQVPIFYFSVMYL